jgi:hypothetical protein
MDDEQLPEGMPTPKQMLEWYRQHAPPIMRIQSKNFNHLTLAERNELLYYGMLYLYEQMAGVAQHVKFIASGQKPN